jgi:CubicO group peptidase (beta-lactamase class C family)
LRDIDYETEANRILKIVKKRRLLGGAVVGLISEDGESVFSVGKAYPTESLFEIGSVTKVFTGLLLGRLVEERRVSLEDSALDLLPSWVVAGKSVLPIRIVDLATHTSGLPILPDDVGRMKRSIDDPYAGYGMADLYHYLARTSLERPTPPTFVYSNLGYSVLADVLKTATGMTFAELLTAEVLTPLGLSHTYAQLPAGKKALGGETQVGRPAPSWPSPVFMSCGGIRSTAADCLRLLRASMDPPPEWVGTMRLVLEPRISTGENGARKKMALAWFLDSETGWYWHNGATGGHSAFLAFHPQKRLGVVVLTNRYSVDLITDFGQRMQKILEGQTVEPMTGFYGLAKAVASQVLIEFVHLPFWIRSGAAAAAAGLLAEVLFRLRR